MLPDISGEFRVVFDPELRYSPSGVAVTRMRVVASKRKKQDNGEWVDDKQFWCNAVLFKAAAEHAAESYQKGDLVVIKGQPVTEEWENSEGQKRTGIDILVTAMGMATTFNPATSQRSERPKAQPERQSGPPASNQNDPWSSAQPDDPPF